MKKRVMSRRSGIIFLYLLPGVLIFLFVAVAPMLLALYYSFHHWSLGNMTFTGLDNYIQLVQDGDFWNAFKNNLIIVVLSILGQVGIAFVISLLLTSKWTKWKEFHRTVIFVPMVLSPVVIGFLWSLIYNKDYGILNWLLTHLGLSSWIQSWLGDPSIVIYSVAAPLIWQFIGLYLIIFMAAIQNIPKDIYEAAEIDGATGFKQTRFITLPLLSNTIKVAVMLCIAGNMKVFDHIYVMTGGGPGQSSTVMAQYAYDVSFEQFNFGYGTTISIGILVLSMVLIGASRLFGRRKGNA